MDIDRLSKSQIVLLTLLVSFVTSIATGIVTVSLMDQAPPSVAQTVNRVIERTVQQVSAPSQPAAAAVTQEKTIIVNESDLISKAVERVSPSVVRLYTSDAQDPQFLGFGVVLDSSGTIATDAGALGDSADALAKRADATDIRVFVTSRDDADGIAYLTPNLGTTTEAHAGTWTPISIAGSHVVLGESVVAITGKTVARIASGIITSMLSGGAGAPQVIDTDIAAGSILPGTPLIDTNGTLVGFSTSIARASSTSGFLEASALMAGANAASSSTPPAAE